MEIISRFFKDPQTSYFLFGPRGTGKSTWVKVLHKDALTIDFLEPDIFRTYSAKPERLREILLGNPEKKVIIIDEIQKIPELLSVIHSVMETKKGHRFVLTGSSARKLKKTGADLLAGRALVKTFHPFMASELGTAFRLEKALKHGLLPLVVNAGNPAEVLQAYAALYLREEIQMEGLVRNLGNFSRFLEAASFSHAAVLSISNVARECEVERKTADGYVSILEDLLLAFRIPVFSKRAKRAVATHPKFYFFDAGVFRTLRPAGPLDRSEEIEGAALEGLVAEHLNSWIAYGREKYTLSFWRSRSGVEVDFIVYGPNGFWAIEVKNTGRLRPEDLRGLRTFHEDYPQCRSLCLYRGRERFKQHGILCLPCEDFLRTLKPGRLLDAVPARVE